MKTAFRYLPLLILAIAWEATARLQLVSSARPAAAIGNRNCLVGSIHAKDGELVTNGAASLWRAGAGLFLSIVVGATLGIFMAWWRPVQCRCSGLWSRCSIQCRNRR